MAQGLKMGLKQGLQQGLSQGLTMTPQLLQSIKLLQMSNVELLKHVEEEIEKNPLLEISEGESRGNREESRSVDSNEVESRATQSEIGTDLDTSQSALEAKLDTSFENEFDSDRSGGEPLAGGAPQSSGSSGTDFSGGGTDYNLEEFVAGHISLKDHLNEQLALSKVGPEKRIAAIEIIDSLEDDGYLRRPLHDIAGDRQLDLQIVESALELVQSFDPVGIAARDLQECLKLQLLDRNHFDPAIAVLVENLELLAKRDFATLQERCGLSLEEVLEMVDEIKSLDPRPARQFETTAAQTIVPDVLVNERPDGSFGIELNPDALPRVLVNQTYLSVVSGKGKPEENKFITDCLGDANWLVRSLEQRAQTILKVMTEIVRQQDEFFAHGISHLRPMSLRQVADAIDMHESTVSRVTSNKYALTNRGMFELKFFFTAAIQSNNGGSSHSAEAVRQRIKLLIDEERPEKVLSDDAIVEELAAQGVEIARRTVAKYREGLNIPSSVERRREKKALAIRKNETQ